jgi:hypothetical protein
LRINRRDRLFLFAGGAISLLILLIMFVIIPVKEYLGTLPEDRKNAEKELINKSQTILERGAYNAKLAEMEKILKDLKATLPQDKDPNDTAQELMRILNTRTEENGISVTRVDNSAKPERLPKEVTDKNPLLLDFVKVKVVAYLKCTPDKLAKMVAALENTEKFMFVERLEVKSFSVNPDKSISSTLWFSTYLYQPEKKETPGKKPEKA